VDSCSVSGPAPLNGQQTYTAYVAKDRPSSGTPQNDVRAVSNTVTVTNRGWEASSITLEASRPTYTLAQGADWVTATISPNLVAPYYLSIYDSHQQLVQYCAPAATTCQTPGTAPLQGSETYTAYVAQDHPNTGPPVVDVSAVSNTVTVANLGWRGQVLLASSTTTVTSGNPVAQLSVQASSAVPSSYRMSVYDDEGLVYDCGAGRASCDVGVVVGSDAVRFFRAYVATTAPGRGPPVDARAVSGPVAVTGIPEAALLAAPPVQRLASQLVTRYGPEEACLVLGETVRTHAARSSVPDVTLVCNAKGIQTALKLIIGTATAGGALVALHESATGTTPTTTHPDCDHVGENGECLDAGSPPTETPTPNPAGGAISPPSNCLNGTDRQALEEGMPENRHHVATYYGDWGRQFQEILSKYGLDAETWDGNIVTTPHRGPHPVEYHKWVLGNMQKADAQANGDVEVFKALFKEWVVDKVVADPTIVRLAYWKCYR
jgi:hypothetical protein